MSRKKKGEDPTGNFFFTKENAREMQKKGAIKKKENTRKRKNVAQILNVMLSEIDSNGVSLLEKLVFQSLKNTQREGTKLKDLVTIQEILGEVKKNYSIDLRSPQEIAQDIMASIKE